MEFRGGGGGGGGGGGVERGTRGCDKLCVYLWLHLSKHILTQNIHDCL